MKGASKYFTLLPGLILFVLAVGIRVPIVDRFYEYSFEPDSESCVVETRSFYFFFKNPSAETVPHNMSSSSTYSDGDYIMCALAANVIAPLTKAGVIDAPLSDDYFSLIVFSMRWCSVFFDALALVFTFLTLMLLTGNSVISFAICLFYYLLNPQTLHIDLMRVDHYCLFASCMAIWATVLLFKNPEKKRYYILVGFTAGLVSATKLNFPFYLLITAFTLLALIWDRKLKWLNFTLLFLAFILTASFLYLRWILYPEEVLTRVLKIVNLGGEWVELWGNANYNYYHWDQFFPIGFSWTQGGFLLAFYSAVLFVIWQGLKTKNRLLLIFTVTFLVQSAMLIFSPKIGRYGVAIPSWVAIFSGLAVFHVLKEAMNEKLVLASFFMLMALVFLYSARDYSGILLLATQRQQSIEENRVSSAKWIEQYAEGNSTILFQYPRTSNPPIFNHPYRFISEPLQFPFLSREACMNFYPPDTAMLQKTVNYIVVSDMEIENHLINSQRWGVDEALISKWKNFYDSLKVWYSYKTFSSMYGNYGTKSISVYELSRKGIGNDLPQISDMNTTVVSGKPVLEWEVRQNEKAGSLLFEIQWSRDSTMRWLDFGSRDGYTSRYRTAKNPKPSTNLQSPSATPPAVYKAFEEGRFVEMLDGSNAAQKRQDIDDFFVEVYKTMITKNYSFGRSVRTFLPKNMADDFLNGVSEIYPGSGIEQSDIRQFKMITKIAADPYSYTGNEEVITKWSFIPTYVFSKGEKYYWRVRIKNKETVISEWSEVKRIEI